VVYLEIKEEAKGFVGKSSPKSWSFFLLFQKAKLCKFSAPSAHGRLNTGSLKTRDWKTQNWKTRHQIAGVENVGPENGGTSKLWKAVAVENAQHS